MAVTVITGREVATRVLRMLGIAGAADQPAAEDIQDMFEVLNDWMDGLKTQKRTIFHVARNDGLSLTAATQGYTVGDGGTWDIERPLWIEGWSVIEDPSASQPLEIPMGKPMTLDQWRRIGVKSNTAAYPTALYFDYGWTAGLARAEVYPVPTSSTPEVVLYAGLPLSEFADLDTEYSFPPGYRRAIYYNVALDAAPDWEVTDERKLARIERIAKSSMADIKRANYRPVDAKFDAALTGVGSRSRNIYDLS